MYEQVMQAARQFGILADNIRMATARGPVTPTRPTATKNIRTRWVDGPAHHNRRLVRNKRTGEMEVKVELAPTQRLVYDMSWLPRRKLENSRATNFKGEVAR